MKIFPVKVFSLAKARLHKASASTQSQFCDDACNIALNEINGQKYSCSRIGLQHIYEQLHYENYVASVIAMFTLRWP